MMLKHVYLREKEYLAAMDMVVTNTVMDVMADMVMVAMVTANPVANIMKNHSQRLR